MSSYPVSKISIFFVANFGNCSMRYSRPLFPTRLYRFRPWNRNSCIHVVVRNSALLRTIDASNLHVLNYKLLRPELIRASVGRPLKSMDFAKPLRFIFPLPVVLMLAALLSGKSVLAGDLSAQPIEQTSTYQVVELAAYPPSIKLNETLAQTLSSLSASGQRLFSPRALLGQSSPVFTAVDDQKGDTKSNPVAEWLEVTLSPVYQWLKGLRRGDSDKQSLAGDNTMAEVESPPSSAHLSDLSSKKLNQAITAATDQYQGILLSVKRLTIEQAIYRIKILRQSGELRTLDYSEEQDQFISEGDENWYANTVD